MSDNPTQDTQSGLSNWREAPHSRWAFHHVSEIIRSQPVWRGQTSPAAPPIANDRLAAFRLMLSDGASLDLAGLLAATATDAMVVLKDGEIVYETYANGNDRDTPHILMSATKAVIGVLASSLESGGAIDLNSRVSDHLPEIAATPYAGATLRHLLDMRVGVVLDDAQQRAYDEATGWVPAPDQAPAQHAFFAGLRGPAASHGGHFRYVSANTDLLGWAIERKTGNAVANLLGQLVWAPMGGEGEAYLTTDREGAPRCTGGLCATARDLARLGQLLIDDGRRAATQALPQGLFSELVHGGDAEAWTRGEWGAQFAPIGRDMAFRSGWYAMRGDPDILFAMGIHGQNLFLDRTNRIVIAKFSSWAAPNDYRALALTHMAVREIRRVL